MHTKILSKDDHLSYHPKTCCCYTTNESYLLPTLVSAKQMREQTSFKSLDIQIICFGDATIATKAAEKFCKQNGCKFIIVPNAILQQNPMLYARFYIPDIISKEYTDIIYIDGDTQINGIVSPFIECAVPQGNIIAVRDPMSLKINFKSPEWAGRSKYFSSIGLNKLQQSRYFNSGVIKSSLTNWSAISKDCLKYNSKNLNRFRFHDQDILNIIVGENCSLASFKWNFPAFLMNYGAEELVNPRIYHFMSNPRPWHGAFFPWGQKWHRPYTIFENSEPNIASSCNKINIGSRIKYIMQQAIKSKIESRSWGINAIGDELSIAEAEAVI